MIIKECKHCKSKNLILEPRIAGQDIMTADMVALKCKDCGKWLKWCPKDERHFYNKQNIEKDDFEDLYCKSIEQRAELEKQLADKDKYTYTGKEVGEIERKYDEKIDTLEQKLKSQPAEIVEKIRKQIFNHFNVNNMEEYESLSMLDSLFTADAVTDMLDDILKEYQK